MSGPLGTLQMQPVHANGVIVAIKANGNNATSGNSGNNGNNATGCGEKNGNSGQITTNNTTCQGTESNNGNIKTVSGQGGEVKKNVPQSSNGVKSVSALLNGMASSHQAKALGAVLTGKVTHIC